MRLFILKIVAVCMALVCVLLAESILMGGIPLLAGIVLFALCATGTAELFRLSVGHRRRRKSAARRAAHFEVVKGAQRPHGPRAA